MSSAPPSAAWRSSPLLRSSLYTLGAFRAARRLARFIPRPIGRRLARLIARIAGSPSSTAFGVIRENLRVVTGRKGGDLDRLAARNIAQFSGMLADYFYTTSDQGAWAQRLLAEWSGWEHIEGGRAAGRGVILVTGHLGHWELGGVLLAQRGVPLTVVTLDEPSTGLTRWRDQFRRRLGIKTIAVGPGREFAFLEMIKLLQRNECVAMLVDRPYFGSGLPVDFCGHRIEFSNAPALLWQQTGAAVIPAFVASQASGGYHSFAEPPIPMQAETGRRAALQANTQRIASVFESIIRRYPDQWFNYDPTFPPPPP